MRIDDPDAKLALYKARKARSEGFPWLVLRIIISIALPAAMGLWMLLGLVF